MGDIEAPREDIEHFASELVEDTRDRILGTHIEDDGRARPGLTPRTTFFSGSIVPEDNESSLDEDIRSRVSPSSIGIIGRATQGETHIPLEVSIAGALYYRVVPFEAAADDEDVPVAFKKREFGPTSTVIELPARRDAENMEARLSEAERVVRDDLQTAIDDARTAIGNDPLVLGDDENVVKEFIDAHIEGGGNGGGNDGGSGDNQNSDPPGNVDQEAIREVARSYDFGDGTDRVPAPDITVDIRLLEGIDAGSTHAPNSGLFRIDITNKTDVSEGSDYVERDDAVYQVELAVRNVPGRNTLNDIVFEQVPESFRYDPTLPGHGHNAAVERTDDGRGIRTTTVPTYSQDFFQHRTLEGAADPGFEPLATDPLPILNAIKQKMWRYRDGPWQDRLEEARAESDDPKDDETVEAIEEAIRQFEAEVDRFERGIELLARDDEARELFRQTNRVFLRKVRKGDNPWDESAPLEYPGWRPFQIVYIVSVIPDLMAEERDLTPADHARDAVSLIHMPTGGGKTEAYLALLVFAALHDRRRGKTFGITAMMRFPLRLLSLQQFQRVVEILSHADEMRKEQNYGGLPFAAGYFSGATPNKLRDILGKEYDTSDGQDWFPAYPQDRDQLESNLSKLRRFADDWNRDNLDVVDKSEFKMLESCPLCNNSVKLAFDVESARIEHRCTASDTECPRDRLHVEVLDQDIYRRLPTMVLGTQDKLAALGYTYRFRTVAGHATHWCEDHGYAQAGNDCMLSRFCDNDKEYGEGPLERIENDHPCPTLTIQDELHLINEELGTFESHYYAAYEKHLEWATEKHGVEYIEPKKIAATATIEEYENQVRHLYLSDGILFPAKGPRYRESFYAAPDDQRTQRTFIGVTPWNRSQINSIVRLLEMHQRRLQDMLDDPATAMAEFDFDKLDDVATFDDLVSHYYAVVTYVISRMEGGRVYKSAENQINDNLTADNYNRVERFELTGGTEFEAIAEMLDRFERVADPDAEETLSWRDIREVIVATSSISHGVDLSALNYMMFFNAPPRMAEYIQASSRVGRKYPGIVLDIFAPIQERDRSHYHYFRKYHEYLDRLVEPVAVNRWAQFSVDRTFPGLLMSLFYQRDFEAIADEVGYFGNMPKTRLLKQANAAGVISADECHEDLVDIYGEDWRNGDCPFDERLRTLVDKSFTEFMHNSEELAADCIVGRTMTSLRDIDEPVPIYPSKKHRDAFREIGVDVK